MYDNIFGDLDPAIYDHKDFVKRYTAFLALKADGESHGYTSDEIMYFASSSKLGDQNKFKKLLKQQSEYIDNVKTKKLEQDVKKAQDEARKAATTAPTPAGIQLTPPATQPPATGVPLIGNPAPANQTPTTGVPLIGNPATSAAPAQAATTPTTSSPATTPAPDQDKVAKLIEDAQNDEVFEGFANSLDDAAKKYGQASEINRDTKEEIAFAKRMVEAGFAKTKKLNVTDPSDRYNTRKPYLDAALTAAKH